MMSSDTDLNYDSNINGGGFIQNDQNNNLTVKAWPKERMLLSVCSKMFKEGKINEKQKGQLKYLVLENNQNLIKCLEGYLASGDKED